MEEKKVVDSSLMTVDLSMRAGDLVKKLDVSIGKRDIMEYIVSKKEDEMEAEKAIKEKELVEINKQGFSLHESVEKEIKSLVSKAFTKELALINKTLKSIGANLIFSLIPSNNRDNDEDNSKKIGVYLQETSTNRDGNCRELSIPFNKTILDIQAKLKTLSNERCTLVDKVYDLEEKLSKVDRMSRKANAKITEEFLKSNPGLKNLTDVKINM